MQATSLLDLCRENPSMQRFLEVLRGRCIVSKGISINTIDLPFGVIPCPRADESGS